MSQDPTAGGAPAALERVEVRNEHPGGRRSATLKFITEVVFISLGVFLALMADQWREDRHTRELAEASLRGFRAEIRANREKGMIVGGSPGGRTYLGVERLSAVYVN